MATLRVFGTLLLLATGCNGLVAGSEGTTDRPDCPDCAPPDGRVLPTDDCAGICVGGSEMPRLTRAEYLRTITAMFGDAVTLSPATLPEDYPAGAFRTNATADVNVRDLEAYKRAATQVADEAAAVIELDCTPDIDAFACGRELVDRFSGTAYRRRLEESERSDLAELFVWSYPDDGLRGATSMVLSAMLQSPHFLYRVEDADDSAEPTLLSPVAIATRLSLFLWGGPPDDSLLQLAEAGGLTTADEVAEQARVMLADPRAEAAIAEFHRQWLGIEAIDGVDASLAAGMIAESEQLAVDVFRSDGRLGSLMTTETSQVGPELAAHYGSPEGRVTVTGHRGILTHASVMAAHTAVGYTRPVHRGLFLRSRVLCQELPAPPATATDNVEEQVAMLSGTDREKLAALTETPACGSCHSFINPAGYAFENFDPAGRFRAEHADGTPIDASGTLTNAGDAEGPFNEASDLVDSLATSELVAECMTRQWFRYSLRRVETQPDTYGIRDAHAAFGASSHDLRELVVALARTDSFRYRVPAKPND